MEAPRVPVAGRRPHTATPSSRRGKATETVPGRRRLFGLLGREPDLLVEWGDVVRFGVDAVLVNTPLPEEMAAQPPQKKRRFRFF